MSYETFKSRQMPSVRTITTEKDYCDLLYAWIQSNSERVAANRPDRKIEKKKVKFIDIEKHFTHVVDGVVEKTMSKYSISKYFKKLLGMGLLYEDEEDKGYYYITVLEPQEATLIEVNTLETLMNTMQRHVIDIYSYLYNRYFANSQGAYILTLAQIKDFIGISTNTGSNNYKIVCAFEILQDLGLLSFELVWKDGLSFYQINWVRNKLPRLQTYEG